jgi:hypothetical protein
MGRGRLVRAHLDCDGNSLVFRTAFQEPDLVLEDALVGAFPGRDIRRVLSGGSSEGLAYQVRFPLPLTFLEARALVKELREGLGRLLARFEPQRFKALREVMETFGSRETLSRLYLREPRETSQPISAPPHLGGTVVH